MGGDGDYLTQRTRPGVIQELMQSSTRWVHLKCLENGLLPLLRPPRLAANWTM